MSEFKRVTLQDVAKTAGVSYASVSAVLNPKEGTNIRISKQTRKKVLECAAKLGYIPNMAARKLKSGERSLIAVFTYEQIFPVEAENEFYRFFVGVQEHAEKLGYDILILNNRPTQENTSRIALADGAVMIGVDRDDKGIEYLVKANFPLVFVGRREVAGAKTHWVTFDYHKVITQMVDHLKGRCVSNTLVYVQGADPEYEPLLDKRKFLIEEAKARNLEVITVQTDARNRVSQEEFLEVVHHKVFVIARLGLLDSFERLLKKNNLTLGTDVWAVVLEDDWTLSHPHWTRWTNERLELGAHAVEYLSRVLEGRSLTSLNPLIPLHLVISESSAFSQ